MVILPQKFLSKFHKISFCLIALIFSLACGISGAADFNAGFSVVVPPKDKKVVRLKNLPANAELEFDIKSNGSVSAMLFDNQAVNTGQDRRAIFRLNIDNKTTFRFKVPKAGHYYLVLLNKNYDEERSVDVNLQASRENAGTEKTLLAVGVLMKSYFMFEAINVVSENCENSNKKNNSRLILCVDYANNMYEIMGDKLLAGELILYNLISDASENILSQWEKGPDDLQISPDRLATFLVRLLEKEEALLKALNLFKSRKGLNKYQNINTGFDVARANTVQDLLNNKNMPDDMQLFFFSHMQSERLKLIQKNKSPGWLNHKLIVRELIKRGEFKNGDSRKMI